MTKLIRLLQRAHAIEIGAYHAYEGHWRSLPEGSVAQHTIKAIQKDELDHRINLEFMLLELGEKPSFFLDSILWCIGKSISLSCYIIGYKAAMWGAKIMEMLGSAIYFDISRVAGEQGFDNMSNTLYDMGVAEEEHELFVHLMSQYPISCSIKGEAMLKEFWKTS